jgi:hypothetical protein
MIPGTPLLANVHLKGVRSPMGDCFHAQQLVVFHEKHENGATIYNPQLDKLCHGTWQGLLTIDGRHINQDSIVLTDWEQCMPQDLYVNVDGSMLRVVDPGMRWLSVQNVHHAITAYKIFVKNHKVEAATI